MDEGEVLAGREDSPLADESVDLKREGVERGEKDQPQCTKEQPSRPEVTGRARLRRRVHCGGPTAMRPRETTSPTLRSAATSRSGSPRTATKSADMPASSRPTLSPMASALAALMV